MEKINNHSRDKLSQVIIRKCNIIIVLLLFILGEMWCTTFRIHEIIGETIIFLKKASSFIQYEGDTVHEIPNNKTCNDILEDYHSINYESMEIPSDVHIRDIVFWHFRSHSREEIKMAVNKHEDEKINLGSRGTVISYQERISREFLACCAETFTVDNEGTYIIPITFISNIKVVYKDRNKKYIIVLEYYDKNGRLKKKTIKASSTAATNSLRDKWQNNMECLEDYLNNSLKYRNEGYGRY